MLEIRTVFRADRGSGSFDYKGGSRIADLATSDIRRILQIRLPNADPYYIIKIESIFHGIKQGLQDNYRNVIQAKFNYFWLNWIINMKYNKY